MRREGVGAPGHVGDLLHREAADGQGLDHADAFLIGEGLHSGQEVAPHVRHAPEVGYALAAQYRIGRGPVVRARGVVRLPRADDEAGRQLDEPVFGEDGVRVLVEGLHVDVRHPRPQEQRHVPRGTAAPAAREAPRQVAHDVEIDPVGVGFRVEPVVHSVPVEVHVGLPPPVLLVEYVEVVVAVDDDHGPARREELLPSAVSRGGVGEVPHGVVRHYQVGAAPPQRGALDVPPDELGLGAEGLAVLARGLQHALVVVYADHPVSPEGEEYRVEAGARPHVDDGHAPAQVDEPVDDPHDLAVPAPDALAGGLAVPVGAEAPVIAYPRFEGLPGTGGARLFVFRNGCGRGHRSDVSSNPDKSIVFHTSGGATRTHLYDERKEGINWSIGPI